MNRRKGTEKRMKPLEELDAIEDLQLTCPPGIIMGEVQLILAEKRTSLASLRTGIAVAAIPMSIMGLLVATSRYYEIRDVLLLFVSMGMARGMTTIWIAHVTFCVSLHSSLAS